ncbi:hypothetical protein VOLCADRAFT_105649 [Volvox carteri f. nagariensis]|uniref:Nucleolar protein 6 n=1 Tax=Volvox carteri f. nagariensis TaxID=3068 RepID=D8U235_VOLCA|nr:uncharacterized protein VOLCADRAFT_105649 [Volvox carteri f. nagariensis]EFJ46213.1 hypothetical protein VOLCADRAFT_105649 [Volvox carteri f. nagariensis]|eukprot:XP_002952660.1 hypothetical protein VOLCADRAFT_105649 [Volvox carteri f. nagariensis]
MAPKKSTAAAVPAKLPVDDVMASDDDPQRESDDELEIFDGGLEGEDYGNASDDDVDHDIQDDGEDDADDANGDGDNALARLKEAARRQQPAGPGPMSAAAAAGGCKHRGLVADTALMLQAETSDAAILQMEASVEDCADELLSETRVAYSKASGLDAVIARLKEALMSIPEHQVPVSIAKGFVEALGGNTKDSLTVKPPSAVTVVGSYAAKAVARPETTVDIAVQLPADLLAPKAHLNHRYHVIRAVYLMAVARHLRDVSYSLFGEQRLEALHGDPTRPVLRLQPPKAEGFSLRLLPSIATSTFALPRLAPDRNGVRAHCRACKPGKEVVAEVAAGTAACQQQEEQQQQLLLPTPHYNAAILEDMLLPVHAARLKSVISASPRLLDGLLLLKVWARQHGLMSTVSTALGDAAAPKPTTAAACSSPATGGFGAAAGGCLDGCILAMLILLLAERNKLACSMSVLQLLRAALQLLADSSAWAKGLAMARQEGGEGALRDTPQPPAMQAFKSHFQVVFVDFTGWLNLASHMTRGSLAHVQMVARHTLDLLRAPADPDEAFAAALLTRATPAAAFDYHWRIRLPAGSVWPLSEKAPAGGSAAVGSNELLEQAAEGQKPAEEHSQALCRDRDLWREQVVQIEQIVRQALTDRAKVVRVLRWPFDSASSPDVLLARGLLVSSTEADPRGAEEDGDDEDDHDQEDGGASRCAKSLSTCVAAPSSVWVGAIMDPLAACRLVDVGPAADDGPAAARFRKFWGEKAELRRWQDGKITETAVWEVAPHMRHVIPDLILQHVVGRHLPAGSEVVGAAGSLDWALCCRASPSGADLAATRAAEAATDKLAKQLRALDNLALKPHPLAGASGASASTAGSHTGGGGIPRCLDPLEVLVTLESSGRWPDDTTAFRKMKASLGLQLASALASSYGHHTIASEEAVDVLLDGFAFRLVLYSGRDEAMLTRSSVATTTTTGPAGGGAGPSLGSGLPSPEESPLLLSWHHGLVSLVAGANSAFAPSARLASRWVAAHMMSNHVSHHAVELLTAAVFGGAGAPAAPPPGSRLTGFLRFLQLVARWPWHVKPLVVDPAGELREADRRAISSRFEARKAEGTAPAMYLSTPRDLESRHWTAKGPSAAALQRLTVLAVRSAALLQLLLQPHPAKPLQTTSTEGFTPSGLAPEWQGVFATPAADFDAFILLRKEALPHADMALLPPPRQQQQQQNRPARKTCCDASSASLAAVLLPPGTAVRDLVNGGGGVGSAVALQQLDAPLSGPDALSEAMEEAGPLEPPAKRARAFLRCFPEKVMEGKSAARLQGELLVGLDPVARLLSDLSAQYGHIATFCVDGLGGRSSATWLKAFIVGDPPSKYSA